MISFNVKGGFLAITKDVVKYVANLARIRLTIKEQKRLSKQLQEILDFIDKLRELDISKIEPTSHILPISNVFREDKLSESLPLKEVLKNAPKIQKNFFVVPKVID